MELVESDDSRAIKRPREITPNPEDVNHASIGKKPKTESQNAILAMFVRQHCQKQ